MVKMASRKKAGGKEQESDVIVPDEKLHSKFGHYLRELMVSQALTSPHHTHTPLCTRTAPHLTPFFAR
jgi:hypothetical protein